MKKLFILLLLTFSFGLLFSQHINFKDKNNLTSTLCSKTWIRYYVTNGVISADSINDSIKFYPNGGFYKSPAPPNNFYSSTYSKVLIGKWSFGSTGKISIHDTIANYITILFDCPKGNDIFEFKLDLFEGHDIKNLKYIKESGNIKKPFLGYRWINDSLRSGIFCYRQK